MLSDQEIFNAIMMHMRKQKTKCVNTDNNCVYLNNNGQRCAIGALLKNSDPQKLRTLGMGVANADMIPLLIENKLLPKQHVSDKSQNKRRLFLSSAQNRLHDSLPNHLDFSSGWLEEQAEEFAKKFNLNYTAPNPGAQNEIN